jgi:hypothetical protein
MAAKNYHILEFSSNPQSQNYSETPNATKSFIFTNYRSCKELPWKEKHVKICIN